jgi:hypothetical protein
VAVSETNLYIETLKVVGSGVFGAVAGATAAYIFRREESKTQLRRADLDRWNQERQTYWFPLLEAAKDFRDRLVEMRARYKENGGGGLPGDFCELLVLERSRVGEVMKERGLDEADPVTPRKSPDAIERTKVRIVQELNYAASSIYRTIRYVGIAEYALRAIKKGSIILPNEESDRIRKLIDAVKSSLQGKDPRGIYTEQQEAIGELVWDRDGRIISDHEFRQRVFEPGWEQFIGPFRFYAHFHWKLDYEVKGTVDALEPLIEALDRLTRGEAPPRTRPARPFRFLKSMPLFS